MPFTLGHPLLDIAARCLIIYLTLLVGLRLTGKRQIGQLTPFDLLLLLLLSNAVQNAMVGPGCPGYVTKSFDGMHCE